MRAEAFDRITRAGPRAAEEPVSKGAAIILSRALYRTRVINLRGVRGIDRRDALQLQLAAWAPFDSPAYRVGLRGEHAVAFAWDDAAVGHWLAESGWDASRPLEPEGLYRQPLSEGRRLVACIEGYEAQVWRAGLLLDSTWWDHVPSDLELQASFPAAAGDLTAEQARPTQAEAAWRKRPWLQAVAPEQVGQGSWDAVRLAYLGATCLLALWAGMEARAWMQANDRVLALKAEVAAWNERLVPMLADRREAEQLAARANRLTSALSSHPPLAVLEQIVAGLPAQGVQLQELNLDGRRLRLALNLAPDVSRASIVRQLQASGFFSEVTEARGVTPASVVFEMLLPSPLAGAAVAASASADASAGSGRATP